MKNNTFSGLDHLRASLPAENITRPLQRIRAAREISAELGQVPETGAESQMVAEVWETLHNSHQQQRPADTQRKILSDLFVKLQHVYGAEFKYVSPPRCIADIEDEEVLRGVDASIRLLIEEIKKTKPTIDQFIFRERLSAILSRI